MIPITPLQLCLGAWALFTAVHAAPLDLQPALERRALNGGPSSFDTGFAFYVSCLFNFYHPQPLTTAGSVDIHGWEQTPQLHLR